MRWFLSVNEQSLRIKKREGASRVSHDDAPPPNGPNLHEKERFEVRLAADRDRQERGARDSRGGME